MDHHGLNNAIIQACAQHEPRLLIPHLHKLEFRETNASAANILLLYDFLGDDEVLGNIISQSRQTPDPDLCLNNLERLSGMFPLHELLATLRGDGLPELLYILGASPFLAGILFTQAQLVRSFFCRRAGLGYKTEEEMLLELDNLIPSQASFQELQKGLRFFKKREILRIGIRDLGCRAGFTEIVAELSSLASAALKKTCDVAGRLLKAEYGAPLMDGGDETGEAEFTVLGMGKLGGNELNFSSDIDLMYFYTSAHGMTEGISDEEGNIVNRIPLPTYFAKLANLVTKAINQHTADGFVFRVDLGLRPEGAAGDMAHSLDYAENYYESWGHSWERSALLKARPVAGSLALGERLLHDLKPFIYRKYLDYGMIEDLKAMKQKIDNNLKHQKEGNQNLKLGKGGIREIEFFIQTLQLIHSGKNPMLRERNSLKALDILHREGILSGDDHRELKEAYIFLRTVENRIQVFQEQQTHTLPAQPWALKALGRRCGFSEVSAFWKELERHRQHVGDIYHSLFYSGEEDLEEAVSDDAAYLMNRTVEEADIKQMLTEKGFASPDTAYASLISIRDGARHMHLTEKARRLLRRIAPVFMEEILQAPEPQMALENTGKFFASLRSKTPVFALLAENPPLIRLLVSLFSTSEFLTRFFLKDPSILDALASSTYTLDFKPRDVMARELDEAMGNAVDYEDRLHTLRRFRHEEFLRVALNDIRNTTTQKEVADQLSCLADVCLACAVAIARLELMPRYGIPVCTDENGKEREAAFCVLALGRLGGYELNYHSPVDIIFLFEEDGSTQPGAGESSKFRPQSNLAYFSRLAQRMISVITLETGLGHVFQMDTRRRPSGHQGPLVTSLEAFRRYHAESSHAWERQALARARVISGAPRLRRAIEKEMDAVVYEKPLPEGFLFEIYALRKDLEEEAAQKGENRFDIKMGRGGLVDVEYVASYWRMIHGHQNPQLKTTNTLKTLEAMADTGLVDAGDCQTLMDGYSFLRRLENKLRLLHDQSISEIPNDPDYLAGLARRLGYEDVDFSAGKAFLNDYARITEQIRGIFNRVFGRASKPSTS